MRPVATHNTDFQFHLTGSTEEGGDDLPVSLVDDGNNIIFVSTWELTSEERRTLVSNGLIELWLWSYDGKHPPVGLQVKGHKEKERIEEPDAEESNSNTEQEKTSS